MHVVISKAVYIYIYTSHNLDIHDCNISCHRRRYLMHGNHKLSNLGEIQGQLTCTYNDNVLCQQYELGQIYYKYTNYMRTLL